MGERIRRLRRRERWSQKELAANLGVHQNAVSAWERGESLPSVPKLELLSDLLDVPVWFLFYDEPQPGEVAPEVRDVA